MIHKWSYVEKNYIVLSNEVYVHYYLVFYCLFPYCISHACLWQFIIYSHRTLFRMTFILLFHILEKYYHYKFSYFSKIYDHTTKEESFNSRQSQKMLFFSRTYRPYLLLRQPPIIQCVVRTISLLVKQSSLKLATNNYFVPRLRNSWARHTTTIFNLGVGVDSWPHCYMKVLCDF